MSGLVDFIARSRASFAGDAVFGETGPYELIEGRAHFAIDPDDPAQAGVFDIALAPRGADGLVRFASDIFILKPVVIARGNGSLLFEFPNRGNKRGQQFCNDAPGRNDPQALADAGNGFLMRHGYTVVTAAWQGDVLR